MFETMQETVDRLALTLSRSIALLDSEFELISHSRHFGDLDEAQTQLMAERALSPEMIAQINELRGSQRHEAFLLDHGTTSSSEYSRIVHPLRSPRAVLGYLFVTLDRRLDSTENALIHESVEVLRHLLERSDQSITDLNEMFEAEMLTLLSENPTARAEAVNELLGNGMFPLSKTYVALCLRTEGNWTNTTGPPVRPLVSRVLYRSITAPMIHSYSFIPTSPDAFILVGFAREPSKEVLKLIAEGVEREIGIAGEEAPITGRLGAGGHVYTLESAWQSYEQAQAAVEIARVRGQSHAFWSDDDITFSSLALLAPPPKRHLTPDLFLRLELAPAEVHELFETFFAFTGNVTQVAKRLHMHRSTVYQHLDRAAKSLGIDFEDGDSRFLVQAWLLQRRYWPSKP